MQSIKTFFKLLILLLPAQAISQTSYYHEGFKEYKLIDRLEIKSRIAGLTQSSIKPYSRKLITKDVMYLDSLKNDSITGRLTKIDRYNMQRLLLSNAEWSNRSKPAKFIDGANLVQINNKNFSLILNPAIQYSYSNEKDNDDAVYKATAGITARGKIANAIGFDFYATGNKERLPLFMDNYFSRYPNVPGATSFKVDADGTVKYYDIRGSITTTVAKFIDIQVGHDRNFIGNGYRSLMLSGFSGNTAFAKINTRIWKLNLENLFIKLQPQNGVSDTKKYLRINTLSVNATKWLNIGIFDAVVFGREKQFDLNYLLPVTFLRAMEQQSGSPDNALVGMNIKANIAGKVQLYSQLLLDEFKLGELKAGNGWWANKYGYQIGAKYIDAFGIDNLDLQAEANRIRPFTYTHFDTVSNYSNNNLPLAHPLGANFQEFIGMADYQPLNRLRLQAKLVWYKQGLDSSSVNLGNNILSDYDSRPRDYGWNVGSGNKATCMYASATASYELWENLFIEAGFTSRNFKIDVGTDRKTTLFNIRVRWNVAKREFDF